MTGVPPDERPNPDDYDEFAQVWPAPVTSPDPLLGDDDSPARDDWAVVIGENSIWNRDRVADAAVELTRRTGRPVYFWRWGLNLNEAADEAKIDLNRHWIRWVMLQHKVIFDIGFDPKRPGDPSPYYLAEREEVEGYDLHVELAWD